MRKNGVIMHISSLPSKYGIGTVGDEACKFADKLKRAGQKVWQILPINQTGYGDSPYQSVSVFAGNPYFIDLDWLSEDGLIPKSVLEALDEQMGNPRFIDYGKLYSTRYSILRIAYTAGYAESEGNVHIFEEENSTWIYDYALFMACKNYFGGQPWYEWKDASIRNHTKEGVKKYRELLYNDVCFYTYIQYLFFSQYKKFKNYVNSLGITLLGDLPIYCAYDSSDVWANKKYFQIDGDNHPVWVAGVPPDYFSADGQLWGNPLYDWDKMKRSSFSWWLDRISTATNLFNAIRIDHFRGLESYFAIPFGDTNARSGHWEKGPGMSFISAVKKRFPNLEIIAEDLGILTDEVRDLLKKSGFPGMRVLQFAFSAGSHSTYQPHAYEKNCVCYTGTHDNNTVKGWIDTMSENDFRYAKEYMGLNAEEGYNFGVIRCGMSSVADLFIAQMQDYLNLGEDCRMNIPSSGSGNWSFRMLPGEFTDELADRMAAMTEMFER